MILYPRAFYYIYVRFSVGDGREIFHVGVMTLHCQCVRGKMFPLKRSLIYDMPFALDIIVHQRASFLRSSKLDDMSRIETYACTYIYIAFPARALFDSRARMNNLSLSYKCRLCCNLIGIISFLGDIGMCFQN